METTPLCFEPDEFESWLELAREDIELENPETSYCTDCLPWYQRAMRKRGLCAFPDLELTLDIDEELLIG